MNIIKLKDIVELGEFKNQYCYCINWKWIVKFEDYTQEEYMLCEQTGEIDEQKPYIEYETAVEQNSIDVELTEKVNSIVKFIEYNKFSPDSDITIDELKTFRTWLATTLYNILIEDADSEYKLLEMLKYYKNEMVDDTIKHINSFITTTVIYDNSKGSSCGCITTAKQIASTPISICDPLAVYTKGIYTYMVEKFSDIDFWLQFENELLAEFKKYIDNIIKLNFPLHKSEYISELEDCSCLSNANTVQLQLMQILKNLSTALDYITTGDIEGHKNFISDSFKQWSSKLYEKMRW